MRASETRQQQNVALRQKGGGTVRVVVRPPHIRTLAHAEEDLVQRLHTKRRANDASIVFERARYVNVLGVAFSFHVRRTPARVERRLPGAGADSNGVSTPPRGATNESAREATRPQPLYSPKRTMSDCVRCVAAAAGGGGGVLCAQRHK